MTRVLIADDEDSMRSLVARAIAMDGHETVTAQDGAEALEVLTRHDGAFDLLLTDIQMPVMDGIALALTAARDFPEASSTPRLLDSSTDVSGRLNRPVEPGDPVECAVMSIILQQPLDVVELDLRP
ncbi:MAG: GntR family transcriptional regulator/MocR family aminotransferase [Bradyrhizobium sp. DFCI-1]|nr:MAG: GntR family transcriptional regulator/MocR family aminotransferase [Bradyrhizobium sp. DFCI-1]